jgi:Malectin domain
MVTNVVAFKQIYAINAGGEAYTDSDGIVYQRRVETHKRFDFDSFDTGNIPDKDKLIYRHYEYSIHPNQLQYDLPSLKNNGQYLLIAKFVTFGDSKAIDMTLNGKIQLLSNMDVSELCGGDSKACDVYLYFCVTDGTLSYRNQSIFLQNEIQIEIRPKVAVSISGLVLLEGSPGEHTGL